MFQIQKLFWVQDGTDDHLLWDDGNKNDDTDMKKSWRQALLAQSGTVLMLLGLHVLYARRGTYRTL